MSESFAGSTETKFSIIAKISFVLFIGGLVSLYLLSLVHIEPEPWWLFFLTHLAAVLASVGLVEFLFETSVKKAFFAEVVATLRDLFSRDLQLAKNLNEDTRKALVDNTLRAQLGTEVGSAVYNGLVERYFQKTFVRHHFHHQTFLEDLPSDVVLRAGSENIVLQSSDYLRLSIDFYFQRAFVTANPVVAFSLSENVNELYNLFRIPECLFREQIDLRNADREKICALLQEQRGDLRQVVAPLLEIGIEIDGNEGEIVAVDLTPSGRGIKFSFRVPGNFVAGAEVSHHVSLKTVISKLTRHYTVWLVEPSANPKFEFYYPSNTISSTNALHFFTTKKPFDTKINSNQSLRSVSVSVNEHGRSYEWVFPPSSVVFMWDNL